MASHLGSAGPKKKKKRRVTTSSSATASRKRRVVSDAMQAIRVQRSLPRTSSSTSGARLLTGDERDRAIQRLKDLAKKRRR